MNEPWPFADPENVAVFTTKGIADGHLPILLVAHDTDDGAWQFLGTEGPAEDLIRIVALSEIVAIDPSLKSLADLPEGWIAERESANSEWKRREDSEHAPPAGRGEAPRP